MTPRHGLFLALLACGVDSKESKDTGSVETSVLDLSSLGARIHPEMGSIVVVDWTQSGDASATVRYSFDEGEWHSTPVQDFGEGSHQAVLLGVPYESSVSWQLVWDDACGSHESSLETIRTDFLPENAPVLLGVNGSSTLWDPEAPYMLTSMDGTGLKGEVFVFIVDRRGRMVWLMEIPTFRISLHPRISADGTELLIDYGSFWSVFDGGVQSQVARVRIDGTIVETYDTPGLHHPFTELADGSLIWGAYKGRYETLEKRNPDGSIEKFFDCGEYFESIGEEASTCASNTLYWDAERGVFLYSLYTVDSILEIDDESGAVLRSYGHLAGSWPFENESDAFWWQHGAHYLENGNLLLSCQEEGTETLLVREYELGTEDEVLRQIWSVGQELAIQSDTMGEAHRLPSGNTLHNYGSTPRLREFTPDGEVVWDIEWQGEFIGRSTPISNLYNFTY